MHLLGVSPGAESSRRQEWKLLPNRLMRPGGNFMAESLLLLYQTDQCH